MGKRFIIGKGVYSGLQGGVKGRKKLIVGGRGLATSKEGS
jgi:hypothetical protein